MVIRTAGWLVAFLCTLSAWSWARLTPLSISTAPPAAVAPPTPDKAYVIAVHRSAAVIPLPRDEQPAFDLIISCLGSSGQTYAVELSVKTGESLGAVDWSSAEAVSQAGPKITLLPSPPAGEGLGVRGRASRGSTLTPDPSPVKGEARTRDHAFGGDVGSDRNFHLHVTDTPLEDARGYALICAQPAAEGQRVRVYVDRQLPDRVRCDLAVQDLARQLDRDVLPQVGKLIGPHRDIDGDGKLAILLTPWMGRLQGGRTAIRGMVRSSDFRADLPGPFSNQADVLYLNSSLPPPGELQALLIHEYAHAASLSRRALAAESFGGWSDEHDWLNEALAHVAEHLLAAGWSNLDRRVESYLSHPEESPLVVTDYYRAGLWRHDGCRGATFLFLRWCVARHGPELLKKLVDSPFCGVENLEQATGETFASLYRQWTLALYRGEIGPISLIGPIGSRDVSGVKRTSWNVEERPLQISIRGTASAFVEVRSETSRTGRIVIRSVPGACLQVTLVPRNADPSSP